MNWLPLTGLPKQCAGLLVESVSTGRILLLQRPEGTWEQPGGHREGFEPIHGTAAREFYEETGFRGSVAYGRRAVDTGSNGVEYFVYLAVVDEEFEPVLTEHQAHRWANPKRLPPNTHPGTRRAVKELL